MEEVPLIPFANDGIAAAVRDRRQPYEKQRAMNFILLSTVFERIAFYAFTNTLFTTLRWDELFDWNNQHSKTALYIFEGVSYTSTLIFAVISDWRLGRAKTVIIGFVLYLIGFITMTITSSGNTFFCHFNETDHRNENSLIKEKCAPTVIGTLVSIALGAGAIKSNLLILGAEQIQDQQARRSSRYFDKYAVAISVGIMIAIGVIPYLQDVLDYRHFYTLYIVAISALVISALLFFLGWRYYLHVPTDETIIFKCIPIMLNACSRWCGFKIRKCRRNRHRREENNGDNRELVQFDGLANPDAFEESIAIRDRLPSILDFAKLPNGGRFRDRHVNEVKSLRSALLVFVLLIPFWLVDNQIGATFQSQGEHMRGSMPSYVVSWMSLGDPVMVIIGILILNGFIYKYLDSRNESLSITKRFVFGMGFAFASMCVAGIVEISRQKHCKHDSSDSELSIFSQLPQSMLIGLSQLFGMVASYEYAYLAAPRSGQSLFMSLHFCSIGMSFLIGTIYFNVFPSTNVDIDFKCRKDKQWDWSYYTYFFNIAGLQLIFMIIFIICYKKFGIVQLHREKLERSLSTR